MVYPPADGHPSKYLPGPVSINVVDQTKSANHCTSDDIVFEDNTVEAKARSYWIKATYAYTILHD